MSSGFSSVVTWNLGIHCLALVCLETLKWFFPLCCFFSLSNCFLLHSVTVDESFFFAFKLFLYCCYPYLRTASHFYLSLTLFFDFFQVLTSNYSLCLFPVDIRMSKPIEVENPAADSPMENTGGMLMLVCLCE